MEYEATREEYAEAFGLSPEECGLESGRAGDGSDIDTQTTKGNTDGAAQSEDGSAGAQETFAEGRDEGQGGTKNGGDEQEPQVMTPEERHRQAYGRRAREQQAQAEQQRRMQEQQRRDSLVAEMFKGQTNPFTGKGVTTEAEYRAYLAEKAKMESTQQLQKAGIDPGTIQGIVEQQLSPLRDQLMRSEMTAAQERARVANERTQEAIGTAIQNISALFPEIKTLDDIAAMPTSAALNELIRKGNSLEDAFYLANRREIEKRQVAAAKESAVRGTSGKSHLDPVPSGGGTEPVEVPASMRDAYREMMPGATDAEIKAAYAKYLKDLKK